MSGIGTAPSHDVTEMPTHAADRSGRRRLWIVLGSAFVVLAVLGVLLGKAAVYQPVVWGDTSESFPGLPVGVGIKVVNNFGLGVFGEDYYVPPQRGVFSFGVTIANSGSRPVIIESVTLSPPGEPNYNAVRLAGPVVYTTDLQDPFSQTARIHVLHNVTINPGREIFVGIPMRTPQACAQVGGWTSDKDFFVREHFMFFSHTVALPWGMDGDRLLMHEPGRVPGQPAICALQQGSTS